MVQALEERGLRVTWERPPDLQWSYERSAAETLASLERRTYSRLWSIPTREYGQLVEKTRRFAEKRFGMELTGTEKQKIKLALLVVTRRSEVRFQFAR